MTLKNRIQDDMKDAMRAKDAARLEGEQVRRVQGGLRGGGEGAPP